MNLETFASVGLSLHVKIAEMCQTEFGDFGLNNRPNAYSGPN